MLKLCGSFQWQTQQMCVPSNENIVGYETTQFLHKIAFHSYISWMFSFYGRRISGIFQNKCCVLQAPLSPVLCVFVVNMGRSIPVWRWTVGSCLQLLVVVQLSQTLWPQLSSKSWTAVLHIERTVKAPLT